MANKIGTWSIGAGAGHQWPDETLSGVEWKHWRDWPNNGHTRNIGNFQFVILDFGLGKSDFDIEAAIAGLQGPSKRKAVSSDES